MPEGSTVRVPLQPSELDQQAEALRKEFRIRVGVCEAEHAMARELILLQIEASELREKVCWSFFREPRP